MNIDLESCFVGFLIGVAIYLLLNALFNIEGLDSDQSPSPSPGPSPSYPPLTNATISEAVKAWGKDPTEAEQKYGPINSWDVSQVTGMGGLFSGYNSFNDDISGWDVRSVTNMSGMFYGAEQFNQNISSWDVRSVTNMSYMFSYATNFAHSLCSWKDKLEPAVWSQLTGSHQAIGCPCDTEMQEHCGGKKSGGDDCLVCLGSRQHDMKIAGCEHNDLVNFCK
jgi:surface protein